MQAVLANVNHRLPFALHGPGQDLGDDQIVVAGGETVDDLAIQVGEGFGQNHSLRPASLTFKALKGVVLQSEPSAKMSDQIGLAIFEDVKAKCGTGREQRGDLP